MKSRMNDAGNLSMENAWNPSGAGRIFFQTRQTKRQKPLSPELNRRTGDLQLPGNSLVQNAVGGHPDDSCPLDKTEGQPPPHAPRVQRGLFLGG